MKSEGTHISGGRHDGNEPLSATNRAAAGNEGANLGGLGPNAPTGEAKAGIPLGQHKIQGRNYPSK